VEVRPTITDGSLVPHLKSWPRYLVPPAEGSLEQKQLERLTTALAPVTGDQDCLFYWTTIFREEPLWRGKLAGLPESPRRQAEGRSPNYVWPSSRDWCICTDYDLCFTLIGGSRSLIDTLLSDSVLECLEVDLSTRIDYRADG
jgi:hypothetical protein